MSEITNILLSIITGLATIGCCLIVYIWNQTIKNNREKFERKTKEIEQESEERRVFKKEILAELKNERESRQKFADKVFIKVEEFSKSIIQCQTEIKTIFEQIKEIKIDLKSLEEKIK